MKADFNAMVWAALVVLICPAAAAAETAGPGLRAAPADIAVPSSAVFPARAPLPAYSAGASRRAKLTKLFDGAFKDPQRRAEHCLTAGNSGPPRAYRWAMQERWWNGLSGFAPPDESVPDFQVPVTRDQSFVTYLYCLQNAPF